MKDYWLAKLISSVREVDSRKRLQKSVYLLQQAGCPLHFSYILHYYGPYSFELAGLINQLNGAEITKETPEMLSFGVVRCKSKVTPKGRRALKNFEKTKDGKKVQGALSSFVPRFKQLNKEDMRPLELAATMTYFHEDDWVEAEKETATFKRVALNDGDLKKAAKLAKSFKST